MLTLSHVRKMSSLHGWRVPHQKHRHKRVSVQSSVGRRLYPSRWRLPANSGHRTCAVGVDIAHLSRALLLVDFPRFRRCSHVAHTTRLLHCCVQSVGQHVWAYLPGRACLCCCVSRTLAGAPAVAGALWLEKLLLSRSC